MKTIIFTAATFILLAATGAGAADITEVSFAFIGEVDGSAHKGVAQGIHEANLQGQFLGQNYTLQEFGEEDLEAIDPDRFIAVIVATHADDLLRAGARFSNHPVFNVSIHDDAPRKACAPNLLHVIPSAGMLADARAQWLQKNPDADVTASGWHPDFVKFAARDLNKRYKKRFSQPMDQYAWAGWAAVKMTSDSVARKNITEPGAMLEFLKTGLAFDGQKGLDMDFRDTGQLRQLVLLVDPAGELLGEAPVRGVVAPGDVDSLGLASCYDSVSSVTNN